MHPVYGALTPRAQGWQLRLSLVPLSALEGFEPSDGPILRSLCLPHKTHFLTIRNNQRRSDGQAVTTTRTARRRTPISTSRSSSPCTHPICERLLVHRVVNVVSAMMGGGGVDEETRGHRDTTRPDLGTNSCAGSVTSYISRKPPCSLHLDDRESITKRWGDDMLLGFRASTSNFTLSLALRTLTSHSAT